MKGSEIKFIITNGSSVLDTVILNLFFVRRHENDKIDYAKSGLATAYNVEPNQIFVDQTYNQKQDN